MEVTVLIENRPSKTDSRLAAEWGLSLHIAFSRHNILFDTGASGSFVKNAEHLSVNLASVDAAVLSHYHYDHGGGLRRFLEVNSKAMVHLGEAPGGDCFIRLMYFVKKYIGLEKTLLADYPDRFVTVGKPTEILPDVFLFPRISGSYPRPAGNKILFVKKNSKLIPDVFSHEIVMAIKENGKLVVFTGCSHNGVLNMVNMVTQEFRGMPVKAVIGGFHIPAMPPFKIMAGSKPDIEHLAKQVLDYPVGMTYTGHCTCEKAFGILKSVMGERIADIRTGSCFEI